MKRWMNTGQMANEIEAMDTTGITKLTGKQCNRVSNSIKKLYAHGGKDGVFNNLRTVLPNFSSIGAEGFTLSQKDRINVIAHKLFRNHYLPWSRIRSNMIRIGAQKEKMQESRM